MFKQRISAVYQAIIDARMLSWLAISLALTAAIYLVAPHQLQVTLYKLSLITTAAWLGYWIDRSLFPYARPDVIGNAMEDAKIHTTEAIHAKQRLPIGLPQSSGRTKDSHLNTIKNHNIIAITLILLDMISYPLLHSVVA